MENKLLIMARSEGQAQFLQRSLYDVLGDAIALQYYINQREKEERLAEIIIWRPTMIITLDAHAHQLAAKLFPLENIVSASLDVTGPQILDRLLQLPAGERVLLVHKTEDNAIETIRSLIDLGIDQIEYLPYWENCGIDFGDIDTAVSTVSLEYCPPSIENKIDIGYRKLSVSAFVEILKRFNLSMEYVDRYANQERKTLLSPYKQLGNEYINYDDYRNTLQVIIDDLNEAVMTIGKDYCLRELNEAALQLLDCKKERVIGRHIEEVLPAELSAELTATRGRQKVELYLRLKQQPMFAAFYPLQNHPGIIGTAKIRPLPDLEGAESAKRRPATASRHQNRTKHTFHDIIATNSVIEQLIDHAKTLAHTDLPILIGGESGTGKEMFAQAIHNHSARAQNPFVAVNFAALPENLIESELFGYEEGAFTGARKSGKKGLFELADTGTIFLDEIGDASLAAQTRLLRVLEEKELMRVGSTKLIPLDIRVIAATNKDLKKAVREGAFREDLYYRLRGFPLTLPPLRAQRESIMNICAALLEKQEVKKQFSPEAVACIMSYSWEGNMRELKNMLEYVAQTGKSQLVTLRDLPTYLLEHQNAQQSLEQIMPATSLANELSRLCDPEQVKIILRTIAANQKQGKITGRRQLLQEFEALGLPLTENRIRVLLKLLQEHGLLKIGATKQGTTLTTQGAAYLQEAWQQGR